MSEALSQSLEDYLEAIFHIVSRKRAARASDISGLMRVRASSVTGALRLLAERELVNYAPYDIVTLTAKGEAAAGKVVHRHKVLRDFFVEVLGVADEAADDAACRMEHQIGSVVLRRLGWLAEYIASDPRAEAGRWMEGFRLYCRKREAGTPASRSRGTAGRGRR
jgi:DtxR family Mn-dependent transcriptional regulator